MQPRCEAMGNNAELTKPQSGRKTGFRSRLHLLNPAGIL